MRRHSWLPIAMLLLPLVAQAQEAPNWTAGIERGEPLRITLRDGGRLQGAAGPVVGDSVTVDGRTTTFDQIVRVQRRDSVKNGILIGGSVGLALGIVPLVYGNECAYETCSGELGIPLTGAALGAIIGWGIDSAIKGWTTIFDAGNGSVSLDARPGRLGVRAVFSW